jgi:hypothetical protein
MNNVEGYHKERAFGYGNLGISSAGYWLIEWYINGL